MNKPAQWTVSTCKTFVEKANSNESEKIFLDSSQGLIGHLWRRKHWKKVSGLREIHFIGMFSGSQSENHNLQNQRTSLQFLRLLCLLLHKKYIPEMTTFMLSAIKKKPDE